MTMIPADALPPVVLGNQAVRLYLVGASIDLCGPYGCYATEGHLTALLGALRADQRDRVLYPHMGEVMLATMNKKLDEYMAKYRADVEEAARVLDEERSLRLSERDHWIAIGERIAALRIELRRARYRREQLDLPLSIREQDEPRIERWATPEEVAEWQSGADAKIVELERQIEELRSGAPLPTWGAQP